MSLYFFGRALCGVFTRIYFNVRYEGLKNIPEKRGFILASNHITVIDPLFVAVRIRQSIHFMAKAELFKNPVAGFILRRVNAFPVNRGKGDGMAVTEAGRRIESGGVLGMFIEGHRSEDGRPARARSGAALIASRTGADVLPCAVIYDKKLRFRSPVTVRYGRLIENTRLGLDQNSPASLRGASKLIMDEITGLYYKGGDVSRCLSE